MLPAAPVIPLYPELVSAADGGGRGESCGKRVLVIGVPTSLLFDADEDVEAAVVTEEATCDAFDFG